jgi:hypothetical protein
LPIEETLQDYIRELLKLPAVEVDDSIDDEMDDEEMVDEEMEEDDDYDQEIADYESELASIEGEGFDESLQDTIQFCEQVYSEYSQSFARGPLSEEHKKKISEALKKK